MGKMSEQASLSFFSLVQIQNRRIKRLQRRKKEKGGRKRKMEVEVEYTGTETEIESFIRCLGGEKEKNG